MRRLALRTALPLLALASLARAGGTMEQLMDDESLLADERRDVYVVEVVKVDDEGATNEHPPKVTFKVRETLRGKLKPGDELPALWMPSGHGIDYVDEHTADAIKAWNETPLKGPEKGRAFVVMDQSFTNGGTFQVSTRCRFEFSEQVRDDVAKKIKEGRERREETEKALKEHAAALEKRRADDAKALEAVDLAAAAKAAPVVAVGYLSGFEPNHRDVRLTLGHPQLLKGDKDPVAAQVIFNLDLNPTGDERLTLESRATDPATNELTGWKAPRVIVFFNTPADPRNPTKVTLVDGMASIVPATPERLKAVREALGLKD